MDAILRADRATKVYNRGLPDETTALREATVEIGRGEVAVLRGPSGSGKTTLLSLLGCMARPTSGDVVVDGRNVGKLPERFLTEIRRSTFGFAFQQFHLLRRVSAFDNVIVPLYPTRAGFGEMRRRAEAVLSRFGLWDKRGMTPAQLSGGEQQRVAIARALVNDPKIVVADEPTAHLDSELSRELLELFRGLRDEGRTVVIATHDPLVWHHPIVDRVIEMRDGSVFGPVAA